MTSLPRRAAAPKRKKPEGTISLQGFPLGLNTSVPAFQISMQQDQTIALSLIGVNQVDLFKLDAFFHVCLGNTVHEFFYFICLHGYIFGFVTITFKNGWL